MAFIPAISPPTPKPAGSGRANIPIQTVLLDGYDGTPYANGNSEVSLDIEMAMAMAPGLSKIVVFEAGPYAIAQ